ncbi:MAG: diguanylate cyclase, partial [Leptospiraceae bacterium]|nr:diguanylate cyclase [Leptospiraceae bacterium]
MLASRISEFFLKNLVDDPETRRRARILYPSAGFAVLSCVLFFLPLYAGGVMGSRFLILSLFFAGLGGTILVLVRFGMVRLAGFVLVAAFLCVANLQLLKVNGIYGTVYMANLLAIISAGTLFGKRTVLLTAAIAAISTLGIAWLTSNGAIPSDEVENPYFEWLRRTSFLFVAVVLHWLGRRGAEKALEESRKAIKEKRSITQSLEQVMEHGDVGHWHWNLQSGRVSWSDNLYRIMGIDRSQFSNSFEGYQDYIHEDDREFVLDAVRRSLESPAEDYHVRHRLRMPDGSVRWLESRGNVVFENDRPLEMAGIVMDITRQKQAQEDLERVYSSLAEGIIVFDSKGDVISMNDSAYQILGLSRSADSDAAIELPVFFDAEENSLDSESYPPDCALREGKTIRGLLAGIHRKGEVRWLTLNCVPIRDIGTSAVEGAVLSFFDITESRNQSTALEKSEEQLRFILENQPNAVLLLDLEWKILYINQLHGGYSLDQVIGKNALDFVPPDDRAKLEEALQRVSTEGEMVSYDIRGYNAGGGLSWYSSRLGLLRHQGQKRIIMISTDITDRVQAELNLKRLAYTDVLSGLPNRQALYDHLSETLEKEDPGFLLFIDLDHFKNINDTLGHDVGDRLLQIVSQKFSELADEPVFLSRLGGDEFMMVMRSSDPIRAEALSRQVLDVFYGALQVRGHELYLSASIGICRFPVDGTDIHQLIKNADAAMYRAKAHGRNRFKWFESSMESEIQSRLILDTRLRTAIPN